VVQIKSLREDPYYAWLATWLDDPRLIHEYNFEKFVDPEGTRHFPIGKMPESERAEAERAWAIARENLSFEGAPAAAFAKLGETALRTDPVRTRVRVPLNRLVLTWFFIPAYLNQVNAPQPVRIAAYILGVIVFMCVGVGTIYGLFFLYKLRLLLLVSLVISRSISPIISAVGSEPRYLVESLPAAFILAALGIVAFVLVLRTMILSPLVVFDGNTTRASS
jgi:hypothetical protein